MEKESKKCIKYFHRGPSLEDVELLNDFNMASCFYFKIVEYNNLDKRNVSVLICNARHCNLLDIFIIYLFGFKCCFQHCIGHITLVSFFGRRKPVHTVDQ